MQIAPLVFSMHRLRRSADAAAWPNGWFAAEPVSAPAGDFVRLVYVSTEPLSGAAAARLSWYAQAQSGGECGATAPAHCGVRESP